MDAKRNQTAPEPDRPAKSGLDELLAGPPLDGPGPRKAADRPERVVSDLVLGLVQRVTAEGVFITVPLLGETPVPALALRRLKAEDAGRTCAVQFAEGDLNRPCVLGCLAEAGPGEARADGQRLLIEAEREIELRCGESVIIMKRNGVIEIRGNYVTSQAAATQRIRGGSVHVN